MKFKTDRTKGGYEILTIYGPDGVGDYAGVLDMGDEDLRAVNWDANGVDLDGYERFNLVLDTLQTEKIHKLKIK